jgi:hypothetical protein
MTDVATLGLAVDSSQVDKGKIALDQLSNSAKRAQAAAGGVSSSTKNASAAAAGLAGASSNAAAALNTEAAAATKAANAMRLHAVAANQNFVAANKFNTSNIAAQFQDIAVSAQMGMGAMQIGLQQGTQLAAVIASMDRPLHGLAAAFASVLSPVSLLTIGIVTLAAAGLQFVDWAKVGAWVVRELADALEFVAPYAAGAAAALALMFTPAILTGAYALTAAIAGLGVAALRAAASFTVAWLAALGPAGWFFLALGAASVAIYAFRDELADILGFDIVDSVKRGANAIVGVLVGSYEAVKVVWEDFPDVMDEVGALAMHKFMEQVRWGLRQLVVEINAAVAAISKDLGFQLPMLGGGNANKLFPPQKAPSVSGRGNAAMDAATAAFQGAQGKDYVGGAVDAIAKGASAASGKLKELAGWMTTVDEKGKKKKGGGKTEAEKYSDIVDGANRRIATLKAEQAALGLTGEAAAKLAYETDLLNEAQRKGIELTAAQRGELSTLAASMASIEAATVKAQDALDFAQDASRGFFTDFADGLRNGEGLWKSFADAAVNALDKIASKLLDSGLDMLFGGGSTGGYGILGSLLGLAGGGSDPWAGLRGYADGTASARAGVAMVGERGPELVRFRGGEQVVPNHMLGRGANNNQPPAMNFNFAPVLQGSGNRATDEQLMADMRKMWVKDFTPMVVKSLGEIKKRGLA